MEALEVSLWGGLGGWSCLLIFMRSCKVIKESNPQCIQRHFLCPLNAFLIPTFCLLPTGFCLLSLPITSWKHGKSELVFHFRGQRRQQEALGSNDASNICLSSLGLFAYLVFPAKLHLSYAGQQPWPPRIVNCGVNSSWDPWDFTPLQVA